MIRPATGRKEATQVLKHLLISVKYCWNWTSTIVSRLIQNLQERGMRPPPLPINKDPMQNALRFTRWINNEDIYVVLKFFWKELKSLRYLICVNAMERNVPIEHWNLNFQTISKTEFILSQFQGNLVIPDWWWIQFTAAFDFLRVDCLKSPGSSAGATLLFIDQPADEAGTWPNMRIGQLPKHMILSGFLIHLVYK